MVRIRVVSKASELSQKIHAITKKCMELSIEFPYFSWEFWTNNGRTYFTACYRNGEKEDGFEFPINNESLDQYGYIIDQLNELKWSAVFWQKEEHE